MDQAPPINQAARRLTQFLLLAVSGTVAANASPTTESSLQGILVSAGPLTPERVDNALSRFATHLRQDGSVIAFLPPTQAERADQKQIASRTASALTNVQSTLTLPPSILSGRADHYQVGERWFDLALGCFRFIDNEYEYFPTNLEASLTQYSTFGGHEAIPHDVKPVGRIEWGSYSAGHFTPPGSGPTETSPSLSFTATPSEIESGTVLRVTLPESAQEARFQLYSNCPDLDLAPLEWDVLIRIEIPVTPLQRLEAIDSDSGKGRLAIQRAANSHRDDAGYASQNTADALQVLANEYGACSSNAALPPGQRSILTITGVSLSHGAHYDIHHDWEGSHRNHRAGENTDIGLAAIASDQDRLTCLYNAIDESSLIMPVSSEALVLNQSKGDVYATGSHVHLWTNDPLLTYPRDLTPSVVDQFICDVLGVCS